MKQFRVINLEEDFKEVHEFTITVDMNNNGHEEFTLYRSKSETWSEPHRGEEVLKIIDTGDQYVFPKREFAGDVGYDKFAELFILLNFISKTERMPIYKGRIEEIIPDKTFEI